MQKKNINKTPYFNNLYLLMLFIVNLLNFHQIRSAYYYPDWVNQKQWTLTLIQASQTDIHINDYYIIIKKQNTFQIYDINSYNLLNSFIYIGNMIIDYDIIDDKDLYILTSNVIQIYDIKIINGSKIKHYSLNRTYTSIKLSKSQIILYLRYHSYHYIHRGPKDTYINQYSFSFYNSTQQVRKYQIKVCDINITSYYLAIWQSDYYFALFECLHGNNCTNLTLQRSAVRINFTNQVDFSSDCKYLINYLSGYLPRVLSITNNSSISYFQHKNINNPKKVFFFDTSYLNYGQIIRNNTIIPYRLDNIIIENKNQAILDLGINNRIFKYYKNYKKAVYQTDNFIYVCVQKCPEKTFFNQILSICESCHLNCLQCQRNVSANDLLCITCQAQFMLDGQNCVRIQQQQSQQSQQPQQSQQSQQPQQSQQSQQPQQSQQSQQPQQSQQQSQQPGIQKEISETILNIFKNQASVPISSIISLFQLIPVSFLFMRFINFWAICSYYLFLPVQFPESLQNILYSITKIVNFSIFQFFGITLKFQLNLSEKFSKKIIQNYGLTSDFINCNLQSFSMFLFSLFIGLIIYFISNLCQQKKQSIIQIQIFSYPVIILIQYTSIMNTFFFYLTVLIKNFNHSNIIQKINGNLHLFFFVFSTLTPFFVVAFQEKKNEKKSNTLQILQIFYQCACNSFIPFIVALGHLQLFLVFNFFFYIFSIYLAFQAQIFKINRIILSSYLIFFHIGFALLNILNKQTYPQIYRNVTFLMIVILFLGAIHQVLTLVFGIIYDICLRIFLSCPFKKLPTNNLRVKPSQKSKKDSQIITLFNTQPNQFKKSKNNNSMNCFKNKEKIKNIIILNEHKKDEFQKSKNIKYELQLTSKDQFVKKRLNFFKNNHSIRCFKRVKKLKDLNFQDSNKNDKLGKTQNIKSEYQLNFKNHQLKTNDSKFHSKIHNNYNQIQKRSKQNIIKKKIKKQNISKYNTKLVIIDIKNQSE